MATHTSLSGLASYMQRGNNLGKMQMGNGISMMEIMLEEARRLEELINIKIMEYMSSYYPVKYLRTNDWLDSTRVSEPTIVNGKVSIFVYFDDTLANHPSVIAADQPDGYVPWLMETGWRTRLDSVHPIYRFTNFEGTHCIRDAVMEYNATNKYGISVQVYHNGELYI